MENISQLVPFSDSVITLCMLNMINDIGSKIMRSVCSDIQFNKKNFWFRVFVVTENNDLEMEDCIAGL